MNSSWRDQIAYDEFSSKANQNRKSSYKPIMFQGFEWPENIGHGIRMHPCGIEELRSRPPCPVRIIFAPLDIYNGRISSKSDDFFDFEDFVRLFELYSIPGAFVSERLHNVACSFGSSKDRHNYTHSWFHFLSKNIEVETTAEGRKRVINRNRRVANDLNQAEFSWVRSAYYLKTTSSQAEGLPEVTLIAFSVRAGLGALESFQALANNTSGQEILEDPYCLLDIVFEGLNSRIAKLVYDFAGVYGQEEDGILRAASQPNYAAENLDFVGLHVLARHEIYLIEAVEAAMATLDCVKRHHELNSLPSSRATCQTQARFSHQRMMLISTSLRLKSLEMRTKNMINLAFHLVTQADSGILKRDSMAMKGISIVGLLFLPFEAIVTLFSTPFFYFEADSEASNRGGFRMSASIWLVWVFSIPLTIFLVSGWYLFYRKRLPKSQNRKVAYQGTHEKLA